MGKVRDLEIDVKAERGQGVTLLNIAQDDAGTAADFEHAPLGLGGKVCKESRAQLLGPSRLDLVSIVYLLHVD